LTKRLDELILLLASNKDNVYIFYPIPELHRNISHLLGVALSSQRSLDHIIGTNLAWYKQRNSYVINHFDNSNYPENVRLLKPEDVFCDQLNCFAVKNGVPLYFDSHHPSMLAARELVELINDEHQKLN
jgi:hypothetical protein